jgi:hypothetical protein
MLGPSITVAGIPFSPGYSVNASRRAKDKGLAYVALVLIGARSVWRGLAAGDGIRIIEGP